MNGAVAALGAAWGVLINLCTAVLWVADKRAAVRGGQRIAERQLLTLALLGGWPAALLMTRLLRHKTRKQPFASLLWTCALLQGGALFWWAWR